jgi:hypothetical protein
MFHRLVVVFLIIVLASVNDVPLANADSVYNESLTLYVGFFNMSCSAFVWFNVTSTHGPFDTTEFTSEPSFVSLTVTCYPSPRLSHFRKYITPSYWLDYNISLATEVVICLSRAQLLSEQQGRLKADAFKSKFEELFKVHLFYDDVRSSSSLGTIYHYYITDIPVIENLWDAFQRQEFQGLSELITSGFDSKQMYITLSLEKHGSSYMWSYQMPYTSSLFKMELNQEYSISLNEIMGHVGDIRSAPEAYSSNIYLQAPTRIGNRTFIPLETVPSMSRTQDDSERVTFHVAITGDSVSDVIIRFKIVAAGYDLTMFCVAVVVVGALLCAVGFAAKRRRRLRSYRYRF